MTDQPNRVVADDIAWLVALYGDEALLLLMPTFARKGGLFDKNASDDVAVADARSDGTASL